MMEATLTATPHVAVPVVLPAKAPTQAVSQEISPLTEKLHGALNNSHFLSPRQVQIKTDGGNVRLEGTVGSFYQKQMAQEIVRRVDGVESVENQLQVSWR